MASIVEKNRKNGKTYYISYRITDAGGKKRQIWLPCESKKAALLILDEVEAAERENREYVRYSPQTYSTYNTSPGKMTVKDLMYKFVDYQCAQKNWGARSYDRALSHIRNYILPFIGGALVANVTTRFIQEYYDDLTKHRAVRGNHVSEPDNISARTVKDIHKIIRPAFRLAVRLNELSTNPATEVQPPKPETKKREQWTESELGYVISTCDDSDLDVRMSTMFACTLRSGELAALTWDCVDISEESIQKNAAYVFVNKEFAIYSKERGLRKQNKPFILYFPRLKQTPKLYLCLRTPKRRWR